MPCREVGTGKTQQQREGQSREHEEKSPKVEGVSGGLIAYRKEDEK